MIDDLNATIYHVVDIVGGGRHAGMVWENANLRTDGKGREKFRIFDKHLAVFLMDAVYPQSRKGLPAQVRDLTKAGIKFRTRC